MELAVIQRTSYSKFLENPKGYTKLILANYAKLKGSEKRKQNRYLSQEALQKQSVSYLSVEGTE